MKIRLFLFLLRGLDRLVRRNAALLNRSIVFCSDPVSSGLEREQFGFDLTRTRGQVRRFEQAARNRLEMRQQVELLAARAEHLSARMTDLDPLEGLEEEQAHLSNEIDAETVIRRLKHIEAEIVLDATGPEFPRQVARIWEGEMPSSPVLVCHRGYPSSIPVFLVVRPTQKNVDRGQTAHR